ncbi:MAG TPA: hypothetical protein VFG59_21625 [Anaeromyxobacter sp.]|nr:hypothetical protein [Anaeromyxobacter sp.]
MWTVAEHSGVESLAACAVYLAAVAAFLSLQEIGLRLRRAEHRAWWAGSGRDLLNVTGLVVIAGAMRLMGLSWPAALLVGGTETLLLFGATVFLATQTQTRHPRAWALLAGLLLSLPVLFCRAAVVAAFGRVATALFGSAADAPSIAPGGV